MIYNIYLSTLVLKFVQTAISNVYLENHNNRMRINCLYDILLQRYNCLSSDYWFNRRLLLIKFKCFKTNSTNRIVIIRIVLDGHLFTHKLSIGDFIHKSITTFSISHIFCSLYLSLRKII